MSAHEFPWNFDMSSAPRGQTVTEQRNGKDGQPISVEVYKADKLIVAGACGVVTVSKWLPDEDRFEMFTKDVPPVAWVRWPTSPVRVEG